MNALKAYLAWIIAVTMLFTGGRTRNLNKYQEESLENITEDMASDFKLEAKHERNKEQHEAKKIEHEIYVVKRKIEDKLKRASAHVHFATRNMQEVNKITSRSRHETKGNTSLMTKFLADMDRIKVEHETWLQRFETTLRTNDKLSKDLSKVSKKQLEAAHDVIRNARSLGKAFIGEKNDVDEMGAEVAGGGNKLEKLGNARIRRNFSDVWDKRLEILEAEVRQVEDMQRDMGSSTFKKKMKGALDAVSGLESVRQRLDNSIVDLSSQMRSLEAAIIRKFYGEARSGRGDTPSDVALRLLSDMENYRIMVSSQFAQAHADYLEFSSDIAVELFAEDFDKDSKTSALNLQIASKVRQQHDEIVSMRNMNATNTTLTEMESVLKNNLVANRIHSSGDEYRSPLRNQLDAVTSLIDELVLQAKNHKRKE